MPRGCDGLSCLILTRKANGEQIILKWSVGRLFVYIYKTFVRSDNVLYKHDSRYLCGLVNVYYERIKVAQELLVYIFTLLFIMLEMVSLWHC